MFVYTFVMYVPETGHDEWNGAMRLQSHVFHFNVTSLSFPRVLWAVEVTAMSHKTGHSTDHFLLFMHAPSKYTNKKKAEQDAHI